MKRKYLILFSLSGFILSFDQLTKHLIHSFLPLDTQRIFVRSFLTFVHTRNTGFAFGFLQRAPVAIQEVFFVGIPVFAMILIVLIFVKLKDNQMTTSVALTSILAGAMGNLMDRIQYGYVIDFIRFHWLDRISFPAFNIADFSIFVGVSMMFLNTLFHTGHHQTNE